MRRSAPLVISALFLCFVYLAAEEAFARGGRGGAGFGGGGGRMSSGGASSYRSSGAVHRSPSMSSYSGNRAVTSHKQISGSVAQRPVRPSTGMQQAAKLPAAVQGGVRQGTAGRMDARFPQAGSRPSQAQLNQFLNLPQQGGGSRLSELGKLGAAGAVGALGAEGARQLLNRPGGADRPGIGDRPAVGDRPGRGDRPSTLPAQAHADQIRNNIHGRYDNAFTPQWWRNHPNMAKAYWNNFDRNHWPWNHWWRPAAWVALGTWVTGAAWGTPISYDYGDTIYYEGDQVYQSGQPIATAAEYYQQASSIAASAPATPAADSEWLPLGVFAISQDGATDANMLLQLAVNKEGVIEGTYFNTATNTARPVKGMVDKKTQRAAWGFADGKNQDIIMEAGISNLTQDQAEALVHFGKDQTQQWLMVRLPEPTADTSAAKAQ